EHMERGGDYLRGATCSLGGAAYVTPRRSWQPDLHLPRARPRQGTRLLDVSARRPEVSGAEGEVHVHGFTAGIRDRFHLSLDVIGTNRLHQESSIGRPLLPTFAVNLHFELAVGGIQDGAGTFFAVVTERRLLFEFLFGDAFLADVGACPALHHGFHAGALLGRDLAQGVGRNRWHGGHAGHGMSHGHFPQTLLDVERGDLVGREQRERENDDRDKNKVGSH